LRYSGLLSKEKVVVAFTDNWKKIDEPTERLLERPLFFRLRPVSESIRPTIEEQEMKARWWPGSEPPGETNSR
jgi:hypothetical protein